MSDLEFHKRLAALERRVNKLENGYNELDQVLDPESWIGKAFELVEKDIEELKAQMSEMNGKLDLILKHLTGLDKG